jgi:hypothetical protein
MWQIIKKESQAKIAIAFFILFTLWWFYDNFVIGNQHIKYDSFFDFSETYGYMAVWGGIWGIIISSKWGGFRSIMGKAIIMFSLGLFAQEFGQLAYAFYNDIYKVPGPYPSLGDFGFFGSIPLYIYGILLLAKASGLKIRLKSYANKIQAILIPAIILIIGYTLFLQGYKFDWSNPIKVFLDFGYPFGQAIYISIAILTYLLSRGILGGVMKNKILFILFALFIQFLSDYTFLYQSNKGIWQVGGINDYMYLCSYFFMTLGLLGLDVNSIKNKLDGK